MNLLIQQPSESDPKSTILYGLPKIGKSSAAAALSKMTIGDRPLAFVLDLEDGMLRYGGRFHHCPDFADLQRTLEELGELSEENRPHILVVDTIDVLDDWCQAHATSVYKSTPIGKNFVGDNILTDLPKGGGYIYYWDIMRRVMMLIQTLAKHVIYLGHVRDSLMDKAARAVSTKDLQLLGKMRTTATSYAENIGYCYLDNKSSLVITFIPVPDPKQRVVCNSRHPLLAGKEIILSEKTKDGFTTHWERIFPQLVTQAKTQEKTESKL